MFSDIPRRLADVRARMAAAAVRSGRSPDAVRLIAVSKTHPLEAVRAAFEAGQADFGENKLQEALQKIAQSADMKIQWHLVGHLQSNKAKKAGATVGWVHSIDSPGLLRRVDRGAAEVGRTLEVLVQVDLALEPTKHGASVADVPAIFAAADDCPAARVAGLMLLPPLVEDPEQARPWFQRLRAVRDELAAAGVPSHRLRELSMGMSHDFEVAIQEGATMVRVGTAIFGSRT
jgi:pyridoxal phosphate enzyme (YggS family)